MGLLSIRKVSNSNYKMITVMNPPLKLRVTLRNLNTNKAVRGVDNIYNLLSGVDDSDIPYVVRLNKSDTRMFGSFSKKEIDDLIDVVNENYTLFEHLVDKSNNRVITTLN